MNWKRKDDLKRKDEELTGREKMQDELEE